MSTEDQLTQDQKVKNYETLKAEARVSLRSDINATLVIAEYSKPYWGEQDLSVLTDVIGESIDKVHAGNLKKCEAMLMGQALALQSIFVKLANRSNKEQNVWSKESFLRLALKAQSQCRNTLETLANMKNPKVIYAKQANIAAGHQQVNNNIAPIHVQSDSEQSTTTIVEKSFSQNELLSETTNATLDDGRTTKTSHVDKTLEAMATVNRC